MPDPQAKIEEHGYTVRGQYRFPHINSDGCCDCACPSCSSETENVCICPDCNAEKCGLHESAAGGGLGV